MDLSALHQYLITKNEVNKLLTIFEKLTSELYKENFTLDEFLNRENTYELNQNIKKLLDANHINTTDNKAILSFLSNIQQQISTLPIIHLLLAYNPKNDVLQTIHNWFYDNFKQIVLLDISTDENLVGGSVISFKGKANDYSLKNQIDQMI